MEQPIKAVKVELRLDERQFRVSLLSDVPRIGTLVREARHDTITGAMEAVLAGIVTAVKDHEQIVYQAREDQLAHIMDDLGPRFRWLTELQDPKEDA